VDVIRKLWEDRAAIGAGNDDAAWFTAAWKRLKIDTISNLTKYYGTNAVKLITGQSGSFDDGGKLIGKINPSYNGITLYSTDTTSSSAWGAPIGPFAICPFGLSRSMLPVTNWNIVAIPEYPTLVGNLYVVHYPSISNASV
jgi:hypothetical protein